MADIFPPPLKGAEQDNTREFRPRFDAAGLVSAIAVDAKTGEILMLAHMNAEALCMTLETGTAHYWSRSRSSIWIKGETSGNRQRVEEVLTDCDQDAVILRVTMEGDGKACHTGRRSCFYRAVESREGGWRLVEKP